jgi:hypothetical protein
VTKDVSINYLLKETTDTPSPEIDAFCPFNCPAVYHRMFVLENSSDDPWSSNYTMKAELNTYDQFAIDGTYFRHTTGLYHVYSCWWVMHYDLLRRFHI